MEHYKVKRSERCKKRSLERRMRSGKRGGFRRGGLAAFGIDISILFYTFSDISLTHPHRLRCATVGAGIFQ